MSERLIYRRDLSRLALGAIAAGVGVFADIDNHDHELASEDRYNRFINEQAARCADLCGDLRLPYSLGFDVTKLPYRLVIPELVKSGYPNVTDGWDARFVPMLASGEPEPPKPLAPPKLVRPEWGKDVLSVPIFKGPSDRPLVALTIDDGSEAREEILNTIINKDVSATFLIIGQLVAQNPDFAERATKTGKITWANHTWSHQLNFASATRAQIQAEMLATESIIKQVTGLSTLPFGRPPGGTRSSTGIGALADLGFATMIWNVSGDAGTQWTSANPEALAKYYLGLIDSQKNPWGSIVLMHFRKSTGISTKAGTPSALELIIDGVRARGMELTSVDRLFAQAA